MAQLKCPKCGSTFINSQSVTDTTVETKTKGFGWIKACLGYLITGPMGILCGLCGMGKGKTKTTSKTRLIHICQNCGCQFHYD